MIWLKGGWNLIIINNVFYSVLKFVCILIKLVNFIFLSRGWKFIDMNQCIIFKVWKKNKSQQTPFLKDINQENEFCLADRFFVAWLSDLIRELIKKHRVERIHTYTARLLIFFFALSLISRKFMKHALYELMYTSTNLKSNGYTL